MTRTMSKIATLALVALFVVPAIPVAAQINPPGTTAFQDLRSGAIAARSPGRLVRDGLGRHADFTRFEFGITEVQTPSNRSLALAAALEVFFEDLNAAIQSFTALLLARAGQSPLS